MVSLSTRWLERVLTQDREQDAKEMAEKLDDVATCQYSDCFAACDRDGAVLRRFFDAMLLKYGEVEDVASEAIPLCTYAKDYTFNRCVQDWKESK